ncbi:phosphoglycerate mutase [Solilutibacter tolerans]|uniref:Regulatory protein, RpfE type n=1 Tax=Solilutibacter tolerans TaxID=1604334 RepID=A0A1N6WGY0_9GAMM|nr:phosphoglycerate mutase [Lysobacter tolerans]SIQ89260.1 hypothetical protein SAMN05421546_2052 [Lysobacter tolerans]
MSATPVQLLLPPLRHWPRPLPQRIAQALGRADRVDAFGDALDVPASAALSRLGEGDLDIDQIRAYRWLRAEPAWIRPDINGARLYAVGAMLPMDANDVTSFVPELQALFDDASYQLQAVTPHRWYLRMPRDVVVPRFATPATVLGADPFDHIPEGEGARDWRVLDNEVQITLHQHLRNLERQQRGLPPINALWWWGDSELPDPMQGLIPTIHSDDPLLHGLALTANMQPTALPIHWPDHAEGLYDLQGVARDNIYERWLEPALDSMEKGMAMQWICEEGPVFDMRNTQRWRLWRGSFQLPDIITDMQE